MDRFVRSQWPATLPDAGGGAHARASPYGVDQRAPVGFGLARIVALYYRASIPHQIC